MDKVKFSCSQCPTEVEAQVAEGEDIHFECKQCGKCIEVRRRQRSDLLLRVALPVAMLLLFAAAWGIAWGYHRYRTERRLAEAKRRSMAAENTLPFLTWTRGHWTEWADGHRMDVAVAADGLTETLVHPISGSRMEVRFSENGMLGYVGIESTSGQDDFRNCMEMAYLLDEGLAFHLTQMVKRVPDLMSRDLQFWLGDTAYAMGAANDNRMWISHISVLPPDTDVHRLPGPLPALPR